MKRHLKISFCIVAATLAFATIPARAQKAIKPKMFLLLVADLCLLKIDPYGATKTETPKPYKLVTCGLRSKEFYNNSICALTGASRLPEHFAHRDGSVDFNTLQYKTIKHKNKRLSPAQCAGRSYPNIPGL